MPVPAAPTSIDDEALAPKPCCVPKLVPTARGQVAQKGPTGSFFTAPLLGPLLFENETSDARDHCANERTFLSHLRLSVFMAVLSVAITLSFHLRHQPTDLERRMAKPLGAVFWVLSLLMLALGLANYIQTVNKYGRRAAIVQTGWRTQLILGLVALCIFATCMVLLVVTKMRQQQEELL
ncbi:uncharacterized protein CPUR_02379 [Claviceps purpurea 20.1]|uniref:DUF202 domain-containing protein n=1 Tax=Claviceps purpurea (strain 20.1) TaxID=1111077 RepID=M1W021_CLAP2|nr:hypothetical protein E4U12_006046 [Claviceps purpurea]CCE28691.1 uncharacterized protein CPUR_02379 [Claviceps purpurea 20.1]